MQAPLRVALVHEWLVNHAGSEKVVEEILKIYPQADLFAVVDFLKPHERGFLQGKVARTTFVQRLPGAQKRFRHYLPLMPLAMEQHDLSGYDLVLSSSHAVAKGVLTGPDQLHVCYIHSPIRYAWDMQHQYLKESGMASGVKGTVAKLLLHYMRLWDARTAAGVDQFLANSAFIGRRVRKVYRRDAEVIHPPVDVERFALRRDKDDFYLTASRMVPYKRMPMIVEAFSRMPDKKLVVIGDGPEMDKVRAAAGPNVSVLGFLGDAALVDHMQRAKAFVFAAEEDFGITPVEAQACGTPVIAFGRGGSLETVRGRGHPAQRTGVFFTEQTPEAVIAAVEAFEALPVPIRPGNLPCARRTVRAGAVPPALPGRGRAGLGALPCRGRSRAPAGALRCARPCAACRGAGPDAVVPGPDTDGDAGVPASAGRCRRAGPGPGPAAKAGDARAGGGG